MTDKKISVLGIIAGKGVYPLALASSARAQGVERLVAVAFKGETSPAISSLVDEVIWLPVGQLQVLLDTFADRGVNRVVMAGQITPTHLFRARPDRRMLELLAGLSKKNAHTIFGAIGDALAEREIALQPASLYMEQCMPAAGILSARGPTEREQADICLGMEVARSISVLEIGQTVVVKEGTVVAVEAFEGTDATIRRAGKLGGPGTVVVKVAKSGHDMRFDIPVIGVHTMHILRKAGVSAMAMQAGRCILLEPDTVSSAADNIDVALIALDSEDEA